MHKWEFQAPYHIPMPWHLALGEGDLWALGIEDHQGLCAGAPLVWRKGTNRISCALGPRAKQRLHRNLGQTCLWFLEDLLGKQGVTVAHCGVRILEANVSGIIISVNSSRGGHFDEKKKKNWPQSSGLRSTRTNNKTGGNTTPAFSKQAAERYLPRHIAASNHTQIQSTTH